MSIIYNIGIHLTAFVLRVVSPFNKKIRQGVVGRNQSFKTLAACLQEPSQTIWFHCASLGEYEQGLPVFSELRKRYTTHTIVLSFFSPSGYEIRKNTLVADVVVYLPLDTPRNAKKFLSIVKPELTVFVKYDIWPNYLLEIKARDLKAILISAAFRNEQLFFKPVGTHLRKALFAFDHIFTQNKNSKVLLNSIGYKEVTVSGDTRFDRVTSQLNTDNSLGFIDSFKDNKTCVVAGSTWPEDDLLFINFINSEASKDTKFIIAPHNIKAQQIKNIKNKINAEVLLFSEKENKQVSRAKVFIIDTIGILSKIYHYADIAYVGGGLGNSGLHNILEPAVFGTPIIIGQHHQKFPEAQAMIDRGGVFDISTEKEFHHILNMMLTNPDKRQLSGHQNSQYIKSQVGSVTQILRYLGL